jgi:ABC-type bacteriocin/lantibiotic exporter with double-glycine peptidase domain
MEMISIGAVIPFLAILTDPTYVFTHARAQPIINFFGIIEPKQLLLPLTLAFCFAVLIAGCMRLGMLWVNTRLSFAAGAELSIDIYRRTLYQPYAVHLARNSSEIINGIASKTGNTINTINLIINIITAVLILTAILTTLLLVEPFIALAVFGGFGVIYTLIIRFTRNRLLTNGHIIARESTNVIKSLQEGLGGIRDVLIDGNQNIYCQIYTRAHQPLRRAQGNNTFISSSPRFCMEALVILIIVFIAFIVAQQTDGISRGIPMLGAFALGAQRLLPLLQQIYSSWSSFQGSRVSMQDTLDLLDQPMPKYANQANTLSFPFRKHIRLKNISFRYRSEDPWVINNLNLTIKKGSRVGFIGTTGSGKSTLLDMVMGLLEPTIGEIYVDDNLITQENQRGWQCHIAHVPQAIFLFDSTIEENIALGVPKNKIDHNRVQQAAQQAQIDSLIESLPNKYKSLVGERGIRLSGGQRQRIGIARALYKKADVIIFDEATSALDSKTEQEVMTALEFISTEITILMIAHRLSTLKGCSQIVEIVDGGVRQVGKYEDVVDKANLH